jgi:hypothetical protein
MRIIQCIAIVSATACSSASLTEEYCGRLDSCNLLRGSVEECIEDLDSLLDNAAPTVRSEVEFAVQQCLERPSCDGFGSCVSDLAEERTASTGEQLGFGAAAVRTQE